MCLITDQIEPRTALKEITVYKVLKSEINWFYFEPIIKMEKGPSYFIKRNESKYKFYSPFNTHFEYSIGSNKPNTDEWPACSLPINDQVGYGWLHAFTKKDKAVELCKELYDGTGCSYVYVEMFIPAGAKYYVSVNGCEICSDELIWKY